MLEHPKPSIATPTMPLFAASAGWRRLALTVTLATVSLSACGAAEEAAPAAAEPAAPAAETPSSALPEVFFADLEDGGTYSSPLEVVFRVENFAIVPVETPPAIRPGEGHYHLAVDVDCAAAGEIIVAGSPSYIHFGTGGDRIELQMEPGEHRLCLQVADGEHRVIDGPDFSALTKEIRITVE